MKRIRTLKPLFWEDRRIISLSRDARLTAIALISAADDRGRLENNPAAVRLYAFSRDRITDQRVAGWIKDAVESGFCLAYRADGWSYLWLPRFWRHQVINKPTESQFPAHPDDPYGGFSVREALAKFRDDSRSDYGSDSRSDSGSATCRLPSSRARGRSFPSLPSSSFSSKTNDKGELDPAYANICERLAEQILERDPKAKVAPGSQRWLNAARLLVEQDGRSVEEVNAVLDWLPSDGFWPSVILSMPKFREKFTQLVAAMGRPSSAPVVLSDYDQRRAERGAALKDRMKRTGAAL